MTSLPNEAGPAGLGRDRRDAVARLRFLALASCFQEMCGSARRAAAALLPPESAAANRPHPEPRLGGVL